MPPPEATPAHVHAFAYGPGPSGKEPSPSTVVVRLAAISGFYNFADRMGLVTSNPAPRKSSGPSYADPWLGRVGMCAGREIN